MTIVLPSDDPPFWTATQAVTWLAFGVPETWGKHIDRFLTFCKRWREPPPSAEVLCLLEARAGCTPSFAGKAYPWRPVIRECGTGGRAIIAGWHSPFSSPPRWLEGPNGRFKSGGPILARAIRGDHRREFNRLVSFPELAASLRADLADCEERRSKLEEANRHLRTAIGAGKVTALGVPASNLALLPSPLPRTIASWSIQFRDDRIEPTEDSTSVEFMAIRESARFARVQFAVDELRAAFPPRSKAAVTMASERRLQRWLEDQMGASPNISPGKAKLRKLAAESGIESTGDGFERAHAAAVHATGASNYSKAGRKSKGKIEGLI